MDRRVFLSIIIVAMNWILNSLSWPWKSSLTARVVEFSGSGTRRYLVIRGTPNELMNFYDIWQDCIWPRYREHPVGLQLFYNVKREANRARQLMLMLDGPVFGGSPRSTYADAARFAIKMTGCRMLPSDLALDD